MRYKKFKYLMILISLGLIACKYSNPYRSGEIKFITKNNALCLYIDEQDLTGDYGISIMQYQTPEPRFDYVSSFKDNYPKKDNCLMINKQNFKNLKLKMNTSYDMQMEIVKPDSYAVYRKKTFCIKEDRNNLILQDSVGGECRDIPAEETTK